MKYSWKRFFYSMWLFATVFLFPWWVVGIFAMIGSILFNRYVEIIIVGLVTDILFGFSGNRWYITGLHTIMFAVIIILGIVGEKIFNKI
jgi:hypothetical protein